MTAAAVVVTTAQATAAPPVTADQAVLPLDAGPSSASERTITLVSGDKVTVAGDNSLPRVTPGPGRERVRHSIQRENGRLSVIPSDALEGLSDGRLDPRLFDITKLLEFGYDDAQRGSVPIIVSNSAPMAASAVTASFSSVGMSAVSIDKGNAASTWSSLLSSPDKVWLDGQVKVNLDKSVPQIGAPAAWQAGFTGKGVKVAVLDTGVDKNHPTLKDKVIAEKSFVKDSPPDDRNGHGTHVASTIAGTDATYKGVAPDAGIITAKVMNDGGYGADSDILAGMQWVAEQGADVANMSLGGTDSPGVGPLEDAVNKLSAKYGTLFVISAGNSGEAGLRTVGSPGSAEAALTVGAVDREDKVAYFSSRGPRMGDGGMKPEITAPGVKIVAAKATNSKPDPGKPGWVAYSGTSMAAPHVAGAAALVAQQHPDWNGDRIKRQLVASAKPSAGATALEQGAGRVDSAKAVTNTLSASPVAVGLGLHEWPHDDDKPVTRSVDLINDGAKDVALDVAVQADNGPDGKPVPAGAFSVSPAKVTVPAGGKVPVSVTFDPKAVSAIGFYSATVVGTGQDAVIRVPASAEYEKESYGVTVKVTGPDPSKTPRYFVSLIGKESRRASGTVDGVSTLRVPKGTYIVAVDVYGEDGKVYQLVQPSLTVEKSVSVAMDAREAKPINPRVADKEATFDEVYSGYGFSEGTSKMVNLLPSTSQGSIYTKYYGPDRPGFYHAALTFYSSPRGPYNLSAFKVGNGYTGFEKEYNDRNLITVTTKQNRAGTHAQLTSLLESPDHFVNISVPTPRKPSGEPLTLFAAPEGGAYSYRLSTYQAATGGAPLSTFETPLTQSRPGTHIDAKFDHPVYGPTGAQPIATLQFGRLEYDPGLFGDAFGNRGSTPVASAKTEVFFNNEKLGEVDAVNASIRPPGEKGTFRIATTASRSADFPTSSRVDASWTFGWAPVNGDAAYSPGTVRFHAVVDKDGKAPGGREYLIPVSLASGGKHSKPEKLSVEVSYDEGKTWKAAQVLDGSKVLLKHPAEGSVSLRAKATDRAGNQNEVTIIKAYTLVKPRW